MLACQHMLVRIILTTLTTQLRFWSLYYVLSLDVSLVASGSCLLPEPLDFSASLMLLFLIILTKVSNRVGFGICSTMWASSRISSPLWASPGDRLCSDVTCCSQSLCEGSTWRHHLHESLGDCVCTALMWRRLKPQLVYARSQNGQGNGGYGKFFEAKYVNNYRDHYWYLLFKQFQFYNSHTFKPLIFFFLLLCWPTLQISSVLNILQYVAHSVTISAETTWGGSGLSKQGKWSCSY